MQLILIRGGGDLASGVAVRLRRAGLQVVVAELPEPLAVRRTVSFAEAVYEGSVRVEELVGRRVEAAGIGAALERGEVPVLVDPEASILLNVAFSAVVDGRMRKVPPAARPFGDLLQIGLGPGFVAGENCRAVVETQRGHTLGRVYWQGPTQSDSGQPEGDPRRVLRAPLAGILQARSQIGARVTEGETVAVILDPRSAEGETEIRSPLKGVLRGILRPGLHVEPGMKVGDVDPRDDPRLCLLVSDKSLAVGGGVLEALMAAGRGDLR